MNMPGARRDLQRALSEWRDAGGPVEIVTDYIEGMISGKVWEILEARERNRLAGSVSSDSSEHG
jgi:hypothetical protein